MFGFSGKGLACISLISFIGIMMAWSRRPTKNKTQDQDEDGLSSLPDDTLTHILSFLTTKQSVSTSVLSTRWKHLSKSVPVLHFDSNEIKKGGLLFCPFVDQVLAVHNVKCIQSFRLVLHPETMSVFCKLWISAAIGHNLQLVEVRVETLGLCLLPDDLFTCQRLVHLKLSGGHFVLGVIDTVCLPALKTFYISDCIIEDGDSVGTLFSNCPVLEDLTLCEDCYSFRDVKFLSINVPSLKRLTIYNPHCPRVWELNVPNLEYINFDSCVINCYSVTFLESLREAHIGLQDPAESLLEALIGLQDPADDGLCELINKFHEVQCLSLSGNSMQSLASASCSLPIFNKLTTLKLNAKYWRGWSFFPTLLEKSPCLEFLVIHEDGFLDCKRKFPKINVMLPVNVPLCFSQSLKEVKLCNFEGDKVEFQWLGYLLENAKILEKLTVILQSRSAYLERQTLTEKLFALPRSSNTCQITVRGRNDEIISEGESGSMLPAPL